RRDPNVAQPASPTDRSQLPEAELQTNTAAPMKGRRRE
ncbi:MAG: hypothetical protein RLZZ565_1225, partial [Planctomycetota bacterium]